MNYYWLFCCLKFKEYLKTNILSTKINWINLVFFKNVTLKKKTKKFKLTKKNKRLLRKYNKIDLLKNKRKIRIICP